MNRKLLAIMAGSTLLGACATQGGLNVDNSELDNARQHVSAARAAGAETCAPELMAKAQSELYWAAHEVSEHVHPEENAEHIGDAIKAADQAVAACKKPVPQVIELRGVQFETNSAELTAGSTAILDAAVQTLEQNPGIRVEVGAHTDSRGRDAYNLALSDRRAKSVMAYLTAHGIAADRLTSKGYGETRPVADNATAEGRARNRRVELTVMH